MYSQNIPKITDSTWSLVFLIDKQVLNVRKIGRLYRTSIESSNIYSANRYGRDRLENHDWWIKSWPIPKGAVMMQIQKSWNLLIFHLRNIAGNCHFNRCPPFLFRIKSQASLQKAVIDRVFFTSKNRSEIENCPIRNFASVTWIK